VFLQFFRTSHILGAVSVRLSWGPKGPSQRSIMFSGDLGTNIDGHERFLFLRHLMAPQPSTYAVVESTYGGRARTGAIETFEGADAEPRPRASVSRGSAVA
jgi:metallo-beta-lactamase family protein